MTNMVRRPRGRLSSIRLSERARLEVLQPALGLSLAEISRAAVPQRGLLWIRGDAIYADAGEEYGIESRPQLHCRQPTSCNSSPLIKESRRSNVARV